jgi:hypothetical protein
MSEVKVDVFTKDEVALLMERLDAPVTIKPSQMPAFFQLVQSCAAKLNPQPKQEHVANDSPSFKPVAKKESN